MSGPWLLMILLRVSGSMASVSMPGDTFPVDTSALEVMVVLRALKQ